jgi:hypothetical protein
MKPRRPRTLGVPSGKPRRLATLLSLAAIAVLAYVMVASAGPVGTGAGFEDDDGNLAPGDPIQTGQPSPNFDWNSFGPVNDPVIWSPHPATLPTRQTDARTVNGFQFKGIEDYPNPGAVSGTTADTSFSGGTKQDDNCAGVGTGKPPNKDDLTRVYLASKTAANGNTYLELAWARISQNSTSSSAHVGFEFNKSATQCPAGSNGLVQRTAGDLLIVYDFEGGSSPVVLTLRKWVTSGACEVGSSSPPCWGTAQNLTAGGFAEARVNTSTVPDAISPPALNSASGASTSRSLATQEFGEAGINLTAAGVIPANTCASFGKAYAVSRSSGNSAQAQMKDLVGPAPFSLTNCSNTLTTTPSASEVVPGQSVTDLAVVQGTRVGGNPPTPTGGVTWYLCGPIATGLCTTGGTPVGGDPPTEVNLANSAPPDGEASATSPAVNTQASPLGPGRYCFRAEYEGDSNYGALTHTGTGNSECFTVAKINTTTVTTPSDGSGVALSSPVAFGTTLYDKAVVTGTSVGGSPTGTVDFLICNPTQVAGGADPNTCDTGGTALGGNPRTLEAGANNTSSVLSSPGVTADQAGKWCFRAVYTPTGNVYNGSSDASAGECVTVSKAQTTTVTTPSDASGTGLTGPVLVGTQVSDVAIVTGHAADGAPDGTVAFYLCDPGELGEDLLGDPVCDITQGEQVDLAAALSAADPATNPPSSRAQSSTRTATSAGTWCWAAVYTPAAGSNYTGSSDATNGECFEVNQIATTTVTTPSDGSGVALTSPVAFGTTLYDKAVVTGTAFGGVPTGSVDFAICAPDELSGAVGSEFCGAGDGTALADNPRPLSTNQADPTKSATALSSPGVEANTAGVWCFRATYTPTGNTYTGSGDNSHGECVTVAKAPSSTVTTPSDDQSDPLPSSVPVGTDVSDKAVVTGVAGGGNPTGTVKFWLCDPTELGTDGNNDPVCDTSKGEVIDAAAALSAISGSAPPKSQAQSSTKSADMAGTWCFAAEYEPASDSNYTGSSDATTTECFDVVDSTKTATAQKWLPNDTATISSVGGTALKGTLQFTLYEDGECGEGAEPGDVLYEEGPIAIDEADGLADVTTNNEDVEVNATSTVSWKVVFTSDDAFVTGSEHCEVTSLTIDNNDTP